MGKKTIEEKDKKTLNIFVQHVKRKTKKEIAKIEKKENRQLNKEEKKQILRKIGEKEKIKAKLGLGAVGIAALLSVGTLTIKLLPEGEENNIGTERLVEDNDKEKDLRDEFKDSIKVEDNYKDKETEEAEKILEGLQNSKEILQYAKDVYASEYNKQNGTNIFGENLKIEKSQSENEKGIIYKAFVSGELNIWLNENEENKKIDTRYYNLDQDGNIVKDDRESEEDFIKTKFLYNLTTYANSYDVKEKNSERVNKTYYKRAKESIIENLKSNKSIDETSDEKRLNEEKQNDGEKEI